MNSLRAHRGHLLLDRRDEPLRCEGVHRLLGLPDVEDLHLSSIDDGDVADASGRRSICGDLPGDGLHLIKRDLWGQLRDAQNRHVLPPGSYRRSWAASILEPAAPSD